MKYLFKGVFKILLFIVLLVPGMLFAIIDSIRSIGKGKLISYEESWSWKIHAFIFGKEDIDEQT